MSNLIERLLSRAGQLDNAGDGLGYYSKADALLDREAANEIAALKSRIEIRPASQQPASPPLPKECTCGMYELQAGLGKIIAEIKRFDRRGGLGLDVHEAMEDWIAVLTLMQSTPTHRTAGETIGGGGLAERIADAVLAWMVNFDLIDAGNEYRAGEVVAVLNDLAPGGEKTTLQEAALDDLSCTLNEERETAREMLAALKQIEAEMRAGLGSSYGETREQVRRAIAKAEGRS